jgi:hypothetical protein
MGLCIFLFTISLAFPIYVSLTKVTKTIYIEAPTLAVYSQLYAANPEMYTCTCGQSTIYYDVFLNIQYTMHEVCSSIFVTQDWISYLAMSAQAMLPVGDFRSTSPSSFQALATLCQSIKTTINNNLIQFYSTQYVSTSITPLEIFQSRVQQLINQFIGLTANSFLSSLSMVLGIIEGNALSSGLQTNYQQYAQNSVVYSVATNYNGCDCNFSPTCIYQSAIYDDSSGATLFIVPGFYTGCYVIEALLQSNLQCFYNQTCINQLQSYLSSSSSIQVTALNSSTSSQYMVNTPLSILLDYSMIEQWNSSANYDNYYAHCQPICSYNIQTRNDVTYIISMLIGVIGGTIAILQFIVPRLVEFIVCRVRKRETRVAFEISSVQT